MSAWACVRTVCGCVGVWVCGWVCVGVVPGMHARQPRSLPGRLLVRGKGAHRRRERAGCLLPPRRRAGRGRWERTPWPAPVGAPTPPSPPGACGAGAASAGRPGKLVLLLLQLPPCCHHAGLPSAPHSMSAAQCARPVHATHLHDFAALAIFVPSPPLPSIPPPLSPELPPLADPGPTPPAEAAQCRGTPAQRRPPPGRCGPARLPPAR
jgi:hypothetical protein